MDSLSAICTTPDSRHDTSCFISCARLLQDDVVNAISAMEKTVETAAPRLPRENLPPGVLERLRERKVFHMDAPRATERRFRTMLDLGVPSLINDVDKDKSQFTWDTEFLTKTYGKQHCTVVDCDGRLDPMRTTIGEFLSRFGQNNEYVAKLKVRRRDSFVDIAI